MGVQGLWELLAPVGRRVSVETLSGKRLAIDASIWMVQFIKAMRDEKGDMLHNAHLIGFFRRICKLLFLRTKPVFVFDGATPALKRRTVIARRRQRENAQTKIRKTAEKLLLNRLKDMRLKEQVRDIRNQRLQQNTSVREVKDPVSNDCVQESLPNPVEKNMDVMSLVSVAGTSCIDDSIKESMSQKYDPKGKGVLLGMDDLDNTTKINFEQDSSVRRKNNQEKLDEMLAASLAAEEDGHFTSKSYTSTAAIPSEEGGSEEDEEVLLPAIDGNVDPAILASLPPSMQLDLLGQMREKLMAENRQKYQKVKKAPEKFSELQIEAYLKTVAFRREINEVQRTAGGKAVGGVQTSRIASEANREFIFSSSFSGDKEVLASVREGRIGELKKSTQQQPLPVPANNISSLNKLDATIELDRDEPTNPDENIEVYIDERGRLRIRNRHMGIQMTRDIQRNLHLMKEKEKAATDNDETFSTWENFPSEDQFLPNVHVEKDDGVDLDSRNDDSMLQIPSSMEISFEHDAVENNIDDEDDIFLQLAAGGPVTVSSTENNAKDDSSPWASDSDWEEIPVEQNSAAAGEDTSENAGNSMQNDTAPAFSKGYLEEEAELQEAIKQSLRGLYDKQGVSLAVDKSSRDSQCPIEIVAEAKKNEILDGITISKPCGAIHGQSNASVLDNVDSQITKQVGAHASFGSEVKSDISPGKALNVPIKNCMLSTMAKQPDESGSESFGGESVKVSASSMAAKDSTDSLGETSFRSSVGKCNDDGDLSAMLDDKRYYSRHESQSTAPGLGDAARDVIKLHTEIPSDTDSQKERRETNTCNEAYNLESSTGFEEKGVPTEFSESNLEEEMRVLDNEYVSLDNEQRRLERNAESVSSEMFAECQELLQIFGIPYIIAPMEAEAQCAFMEQLNLVDGIVTDDSDVFLFGARSVYKNIFDDRKYVETYFMKDIEKELGLSRDKLIRMAMLLGSDYTEGISGIGIVNAIEVVTAFPEEDGLKKLRDWVESPDPTILGNNADAKTCSDDTDEMKKTFMNKHRKVSKNWHIPSTFPSEAVTSAYLNPQVDRSAEVFSWGKPDLSILRKLCWEKFGWNIKKTDDLLLPVLKEYEKRETQLRLEAFYSFSERFAKIRSKRIKKAVKGIGGGLSSEMASHEPGDNTSDKASPEPNANESKRGKGRGRAQKRGRGRGRSQRNLQREQSDDTSDDDKVVDTQGCHDTKPSSLQNVRRSTRSRNPVKYNAKEDDELEELRSNGSCSRGENLENDDFLKDKRVVENTIDRDSAEQRGGSDAYEAETGEDDYRVIGGGFCVDEDGDEIGEEDEMQKMNTPKRKRGNSSLEANVEEIETGNSSAGGLSAMPFLKRKKRKS